MPSLRNDRKDILNKSKAVLQENAISASDILNISWKLENSSDWVNGKHIDFRNICVWWERCQRSCLAALEKERGGPRATASLTFTVVQLWEPAEAKCVSLRQELREWRQSFPGHFGDIRGQRTFHSQKMYCYLPASSRRSYCLSK